MPIVCSVKFRGVGKAYHFDPGEHQNIDVGDFVIVETTRGTEMAQVVRAPYEVTRDEIVGKLKPVIRRASTLDLLDAQSYRDKETRAVETCREQIERFSLPMKVVSAEYNHDGSRLTFFFTSEKRVDFRELVRELARIFRARIELRQIGVRDEAKILGGVGKCGRQLCCATWLTDFSPVSIRMAKTQNLPLSPMEISGCCGRLLCCLGYENDYYKEIKSQFPRTGKKIETPLGEAKVLRVNVLKETLLLLLADGSRVEMTNGQVKGEESLDNLEGTQRLSGMQRSAVARAVGQNSGESESEPSPDRTSSESNAPKRSSSSSRRSRRRRKPSGASGGQGTDSKSTGNAPQAQPTNQGGAKQQQGTSGQSQSTKRRRRRRPRRRSSSSRSGSSTGQSSTSSQSGSGGNQSGSQS